MFTELKKQWGTMDFLVHAIGFSDKNELKGRYADTTRVNFERTMVISCFSFTEAAKRAAEMMPNGGSMITLTYNGGDRAMPNYNVMGVAKAETPKRRCAIWPSTSGRRRSASTRYRRGRSARWPEQASMTPATCSHSSRSIRRSGRGVSLEDLGGSGLYLLSDLSSGVTGEIHFVDSGYNVIAMPQPDALRAEAH